MAQRSGGSATPPKRRHLDSDVVWPVLAVPRLERTVNEPLVSSGMCIVHHSRSMEDLEQR